MKRLVKNPIWAIFVIIALITPVVSMTFTAMAWGETPTTGAAETQTTTSDVATTAAAAETAPTVETTTSETPVIPVVTDPVETAPAVDPVSTPVETPTIPVTTPDPVSAPAVTVPAQVPVTQSATAAVYDDPPPESSCGVVTFSTPTEMTVESGQSFGVSGSFNGSVLTVDPSWGGGWTDDMASTFNISMFAPSEVGTYYVNFGDQDTSCPRYTVTVHVVASTAICGVVTFTTPTEVTVVPGESVRIAGSFNDPDSSALVGELSWGGADAVANPFDMTVTPPATVGTYYVYLRDQVTSCSRYTVTIHVVAADINPITDPGTTDPDSNAAQNNYGSGGQDTNGTNGTNGTGNTTMLSSLPVTGIELVPYAALVMTLALVGIGLRYNKRLIPSVFRRKTGDK